MSAADGAAGAGPQAALQPAATDAASDRDRTDAVVAIALLIVANKPIYPLYVWWFAGTGTAAAFLTALSTPVFLGVVLWGRRHPAAAALALPLTGAIDTVLATALFGTASGAELFFVPCLLLAILAQPARADRRVKGMVALLFVGFVAAHRLLGPPLGPWTVAEAERLAEVNVWAVASLSAFIGWRFGALRR